MTNPLYCSPMGENDLLGLVDSGLGLGLVGLSFGMDLVAQALALNDYHITSLYH